MYGVVDPGNWLVFGETGVVVFVGTTVGGIDLGEGVSCDCAFTPIPATIIIPKRMLVFIVFILFNYK